MENSLPNGWIEISPLEISEKIRGVSYDKSEASKTTQKNYLPILRANNIDDNEFDYDDLVYVPKERVSANQKLQKGDVVIAMSSGSKSVVGKTAQSNNSWDGSFGAFCGVLRPDKLINGKYFGYYFQTKAYRNLISELASGTNINNLKNEHFDEIKFPLSPLAEQYRIVAKLDALLARVANCKNRLEKIPGLLKNFRQSVLAAAVSGELTEEWRKQNKDVQTGSALLRDLVQFRRTLEAATGGTKKQKMNFGDEEDRYLPESWTWTRMINLAEITGGVTKGRKLQNKETIHLPYLRVANVQDGYLDLSEVKEIEVLPTDLEKYKLVDGDILFTEGGDRDKLGRGTIWNNEIENCIHQNHIFRARVFKGFIDPKYISFFTKTKVAKDYFYENASQTVNLASINLTTLSNVPIALPPIEEQQEIVRKVEELFHFADSIEIRYQKAKAWFDKIPQAILAKAFRGELVEQDENDEPASVLLERIKKEKATSLRGGTTKQSPNKKQTNKPKPTAKRKKVYEENEGVSLAAEE